MGIFILEPLLFSLLSGLLFVFLLSFFSLKRYACLLLAWPSSLIFFLVLWRGITFRLIPYVLHVCNLNGLMTLTPFVGYMDFTSQMVGYALQIVIKSLVDCFFLTFLFLFCSEPSRVSALKIAGMVVLSNMLGLMMARSLGLPIVRLFLGS